MIMMYLARQGDPGAYWVQPGDRLEDVAGMVMMRPVYAALDEAKTRIQAGITYMGAQALRRWGMGINEAHRRASEEAHYQLPF